MEVLAATNGSAALFLLGLLLVVGVLLMRAQRNLKRGAPGGAGSLLSSAARTAATPGETTLPPDAPRALARWEVALHEVAREHTARLDTKIAALQQLIQTARRESLRLEGLLAETARAGANRRMDAASSAPAAGPHAPSQLTLGTIPLAAAATGGPPARSADNRPYERIYALADQGRDPAAIAREVGLPLGEVDLVLDLRRRQ